MILRLGLNFTAHCLAGIAFGALGAYVACSSLPRQGGSAQPSYDLDNSASEVDGEAMGAEHD